jgi:cell division septation protein DedD
VSDENKPDALDDGDDLLSDFNDLFPDESDDDLHELAIDDDADDLDSLLEDLDAPEADGADEDDIDSLLDSLDDSLDSDDTAEPSVTDPVEESVSDESESDLDSLLDGLEEHVDEMIDDGDEEDLDSLLEGLKEDEDVIADTDGMDDGDDLEDLDSLLDEMVAEAKPADVRELDIDQEDLNLAIEDDMDDLISNDEDTLSANELVAAAAATAAAATVATTTATENHKVKSAEPPAETASAHNTPVKSESRSSGVGNFVIYTLLIITLAAAGGAFWLVLQAQQSADINKAQIAKLQKQSDRGRTASEGMTNPQIDKNSSAIRNLEQRVNELSTMVEGPLSHINSGNNEEMLARYASQVEQLERQFIELKQESNEQLSLLRGELEKKPAMVAATTSPPLLLKAAESSNKPGALWALNLLSLSNRQGADDEIKRLQSAGINASREQFTSKSGKSWYRVRVTGFDSYDAAKAYSREMPKLPGIDNTWVTTQ